MLQLESKINIGSYDVINYNKQQNINNIIDANNSRYYNTQNDEFHQHQNMTNNYNNNNQIGGIGYNEYNNNQQNNHNKSVLSFLMNMGFDKHLSIQSLIECGDDIEQCINFITTKQNNDGDDHDDGKNADLFWCLNIKMELDNAPQLEMYQTLIDMGFDSNLSMKSIEKHGGNDIEEHISYILKTKQRDDPIRTNNHNTNRNNNRKRMHSDMDDNDDIIDIEPQKQKQKLTVNNYNKHKLDWNLEECAQWIGSLGIEYKQYMAIFKKSGISGAFLNDLDDDALSHIMASNRLHRKKILFEWKRL